MASKVASSERMLFGAALRRWIATLNSIAFFFVSYLFRLRTLFERTSTDPKAKQLTCDTFDDTHIHKQSDNVELKSSSNAASEFALRNENESRTIGNETSKATMSTTSDADAKVESSCALGRASTRSQLECEPLIEEDPNETQTDLELNSRDLHHRRVVDQLVAVLLSGAFTALDSIAAETRKSSVETQSSAQTHSESSEPCDATVESSNQQVDFEPETIRSEQASKARTQRATQETQVARMAADNVSFAALSTLRPVIKRPSEQELIEAKSRLTKARASIEQTRQEKEEEAISDEDSSQLECSQTVEQVDKEAEMQIESTQTMMSQRDDVDELILRPISALSLRSTDIDSDSELDADSCSGAIQSVDCSQEESISSLRKEASGPIEFQVDCDDHFCARPASDATLQRLRKDAREDIQVCDQSRANTQAARRLFADRSQTAPTRPLNASDRRDKSGSAEESPEVELVESTSDHNSGSIKLVRRNGSTASGSSNSPMQFGRHLVCCVSPVNQPDSKWCGAKQQPSSNSSGTSSAPEDEIEAGALFCRSNATRTGSQVGQTSNGDIYPLDDVEMRQCQTAFRENKRRLIESTRRAVAGSGSADDEDDDEDDEDHDEVYQTYARVRPQSAPLSEWHSNRQLNRRSTRTGSSSNTGLWRTRLSTRDLSNKQESVCSTCKQRLYPMDRLELDFTRTKLNIHKNCFKCQVCSTLLRLQTYAAIDAKLYCPAHIRLAPQLHSSAHTLLRN